MIVDERDCDEELEASAEGRENGPRADVAAPGWVDMIAVVVIQDPLPVEDAVRGGDPLLPQCASVARRREYERLVPPDCQQFGEQERRPLRRRRFSEERLGDRVKWRCDGP